ncbi:Transcription factor [Aspergillus sp. HF37]|nr:Transcription factor [Aspergillus sp. HF37]
MSEQQRWKPLAPAPPAPSSGFFPGLSKSISRRKNVARACSACRQRKAKCTGRIPCNLCRENNTDCSIDQDTDERRKITQKRKAESLEQDRDLLLRLVKVLRDENPKAVELLNLIRSNASLDETRRSIDDRLDSLPYPSTERPSLNRLRDEIDVAHGNTPNTRRKMMNINRLWDVTLFKVPAKPWTSLTSDDDLVSHLLSLWFTWQQQGLHCIDRDLLVRDMQSADLNSNFCSPFLVNILLAEACFYSDYPETFAVYPDISSKGMHFYHEAKSLLEREEGRITVPTVQGLGSMYFCSSAIGKGRLGWMYMCQAAAGAQELSSSKRQLLSEAGEASQDMELAIDVAVGGIFSSTTIGSLALQKPPPMSRKHRTELLPVTHDNDDRDMWIPYPRHSGAVPAHTHCVFNSLTSLTEIVRDAANLLFGEEKPPRVDLERAIDGFYSRVCRWHEQLPSCLNSETNPTPGILDLQLRYHILIMTIFGFLKRPADSEPSGLTSANHAQERCVLSAREVTWLIETFRSRWRLYLLPVSFTQHTTISLFTLLEALDDNDNRTAFVQLCIVSRSFARRWAVAKGMLRLVQLSAKQMGVDLPPEASTLFESVESKVWRPGSSLGEAGWGG